MNDKQKEEADRLLTVTEVANLCHVSERKVKEWLSQGKIMQLILDDRITRVRESDLMKFWAESEKKAAL